MRTDRKRTRDLLKGLFNGLLLSLIIWIVLYQLIVL